MTNDSIVFLVDTNVLVYTHDFTEAAKQQRAVSLLNELEVSQAGALSVQVLGEFFNATTRRLKPPLSQVAAAEAVARLYESWTVLDLYRSMVLDAVRGVTQHRLSYYDALIWATAKYHGVPFVLSEDLNNGQIIEGVRIVNPFVPNFDLALLS